ncbi:MAG: slipin family protein [Candidatus Paceibacterota bacterium]
MLFFKRIKIRSYEVGLYFRDGEFKGLLGEGRHWLFDLINKVRVDVASQRDPWLAHDKLDMIFKSGALKDCAVVMDLKDDQRGLVWIEGCYIDTLPPGLYAFWKGAADSRVVEIDMRETTIDVSGQEIMTADKVSLRMNALVTYRIADARKAVSSTDDVRQALYRETQLALRAIVGVRDLDVFLSDKDVVAQEIEQAVRRRAGELGLSVVSVGIRDVILPGDMKDLMNKVTEAKKAAEANLISRREETAAMRSQANTAKLLADNPTLMRLRELEVLEKIASAGHLNIVLGEKGLAERVVNLL